MMQAPMQAGAFLLEQIVKRHDFPHEVGILAWSQAKGSDKNGLDTLTRGSFGDEIIQARVDFPGLGSGHSIVVSGVFHLTEIDYSVSSVDYKVNLALGLSSAAPPGIVVCLYPFYSNGMQYLRNVVKADSLIGQSIPGILPGRIEHMRPILSVPRMFRTEVKIEMRVEIHSVQVGRM